MRFTSARATVPLTLPSHATILTGLLPPVHGVRENGLDALNDVMAHNIDFQFSDPVTVKQMIADGRLKALMLTSAEAFQAFSDQRLGPAVQQIGIQGDRAETLREL